MTTVLALGVGAVLLALALRVDRWRERAPALAAADGAPEGPGAVTVLLPARDEEENVEACVRGLLARPADPPVPARVVVIDDGSTDRTAEIVRRLTAEEPRVELVEAPPLPAGWKGKVHALETGLGRVATPWLLSTDADTRHHPDLLARALATARERRLDSLSLAGRQEARGAGENLVTPVVFACLDALLGDWEPAAAGESAVANGQFFLVRTDALRAAGGFAGVRGAAIDDVALAGRLRAAGFRHGFVRAPDLLRVRMYRGLGATVRGWRRNLGAIFTGRRLAAALGLAALLAPPALLVALLVGGCGLPALLLWVCGAAASALLRRGSEHAPAYGLIYPLDAVATGACLALGLRDAARGALAPWKGRPVPLE